MLQHANAMNGFVQRLVWSTICERKNHIPPAQVKYAVLYLAQRSNGGVFVGKQVLLSTAVAGKNGEECAFGYVILETHKKRR